MRTQPVPLVGGAYTDDTRPWSQQDTLNYLPTSAERAGTRSQAILKTPPGLRPYVEVVGGGAVRGAHNAEGRFFVVVDSTMYRISNTGVLIPLGSIPGVDRVSIDHNQISLGNQVMVVNGSAGYVYNTTTQTLVRITDAGFPGAKVVRFIGGYMVGIEPSGRYAFNSAVADATSYNTLDRFTSEYAPDALVGLAAVGGDLLLLSKSTGEFFGITSNVPQPFRSKRIYLDKGCASPHSVVEADNTVFWLGNDGYFYKLEGYAARRISTRPIEQAIRGLNWEQAFGFVWEDAGHTVVYWTFPDGRTWGWDTSENEWHRRESYGIDRWRPSTMTFWRNEWYAGDFQSGRVWKMDWEYMLEGDTPFISRRTIGVIHDNQNAVLIPRLELVMDTGQDITVAEDFPVQPVGPLVSGDSPNTYIGADYSFSYTITEGDAPVVSVSIVGGDLPEGAEITTAGVLTVPTTKVGTFSYTIRAVDANGLFYDHPDTLTIVSAWWALRTNGGQPEKLWISPDLDTWVEFDRGPAATVTPIWGAQIQTGAVLINTDLSDAGERVLNPAATLSTVPAIVGDDTRLIRRFDNCTIVEQGHSQGQSYYVTTNGGDSFITVTMAGGRAIHGINRLSNGRWIAYRNLGSDFRFVYSDADIPLSDGDWVESTIPSTPLVNYYLTFVEGETGYAVRTNGDFARTVGGASWTMLNPNGLQDTDVRDGVAYGDVLIVVGQASSASQHMAVSADRGESFVPVVFTDLSSIERIERSVEGLLVVSGMALDGGSIIVHTADESDPLTWTPATNPFTVTSFQDGVTIFPVVGVDD